MKEQLVQSINPLSDVEIITTNRLGKAVVRHLSFAFNRSVADGKVSQLLVTVQDITERKELEAALQKQKQGAQREFSMMLKALETDAGELGQFVTRSEQDLLEVNKELRNLSSSNSPDQFKSMVRTVFRQVHTFKGEAQSLGLEILSVEAEKMEQLLENLRSSEEPAQDQVLQLPIFWRACWPSSPSSKILPPSNAPKSKPSHPS
ncbi:MAG: hypothetical protein HC858_09800 [Brachymonas sp.]|nr:hypothetical protein [Brachymonas sp.]